MRLRRPAALIGWLGVAIFLTSSVVTALAYVGSAGESYSPLNHYVSELGERRNSELGAVFNAGVALGGLCLGVLLIVVGRLIGGLRGLLIGVLGALAGVSGTGVGLVPMDEKAPHLLVSGVFFLALAASVGLATLWSGRTGVPRRRSLTALGLLTVIASVAFFLIIRLEGPGPGGAADVKAPRPPIALDTSVEWLALLGVMAWVAAEGLVIWRADSAVAAQRSVSAGLSPSGGI